MKIHGLKRFSYCGILTTAASIERIFPRKASVASTLLAFVRQKQHVQAFRLERPPANTRPRRRHARHISSSSHEGSSDTQSARSQGDNRGIYCSVVNKGDDHIRHQTEPSPDEDHAFEDIPILVPAEAPEERELMGTETRQRDTNGGINSNGVGGIVAGGVSGGSRGEDQRQSEKDKEEYESAVQRDADTDADLWGTSGEEEGRRGDRRAQRLVTLTSEVESDVVVTGFEEVHSERGESPAVETEASDSSMQASAARYSGKHSFGSGFFSSPCCVLLPKGENTHPSVVWLVVQGPSCRLAHQWMPANQELLSLYHFLVVAARTPPPQHRTQPVPPHISPDYTIPDRGGSQHKYFSWLVPRLLPSRLVCLTWRSFTTCPPGFDLCACCCSSRGLAGKSTAIPRTLRARYRQFAGGTFSCAFSG